VMGKNHFRFTIERNGKGNRQRPRDSTQCTSISGADHGGKRNDVPVTATVASRDRPGRPASRLPAAVRLDPVGRNRHISPGFPGGLLMSVARLLPVALVLSLFAGPAAAGPVWVHYQFDSVSLPVSDVAAGYIKLEQHYGGSINAATPQSIA